VNVGHWVKFFIRSFIGLKRNWNGCCAVVNLREALNGNGALMMDGGKRKRRVGQGINS
jgi:hypothetical protein